MKEEEIQDGHQINIGENLTNGSHFPVGQYSDNAQMTSKRGEKNVLTSFVRCQSADPRKNGIYLSFTITKTFEHIPKASSALTELNQNFLPFRITTKFYLI